MRVKTPGVWLLTALCAAGMAWYLLAGAGVFALGGLIPSQLAARPWTLLAYPFIHGDWPHLVFNLAAVWLFGFDVEQRWGTAPFLLYFIACTAATGLLYAALWPGERNPLIGASGGAFGLIAAASRLFPDDVLSLYFVMPIRYAKLALLFVAALVFSLAMAPGSAASRVAHLAGLACGLLLTYAVPRLRP